MHISVIGCRPPTLIDVNEPYEQYKLRVELFERILADVTRFMEELPPGTIIVSGGAQGVDRHAIAVAKRLGFEFREYLPKYFHYGKRLAPLKRNEEIVLDSDEVHGWPAPWSSGTLHALAYAERIWVPNFKHVVE